MPQTWKRAEWGAGKSAFGGKTCCGSWSLWSVIGCKDKSTSVEVDFEELDKNLVGIVDEADIVCKLTAVDVSKAGTPNVAGRVDDEDMQKAQCWICWHAAWVVGAGTCCIASVELNDVVARQSGCVGIWMFGIGTAAQLRLHSMMKELQCRLCSSADVVANTRYWA